ncbi:MAG: hypothetical protein IKD99_05180 [Erysipelotrichaceae bacterium]|nr:hypothetical protein [Erysipelotrichaceae bacterium]
MQGMEYNDLWLILQEMDKDKTALIPEKYRELVKASMVPDAVSEIDPHVELEKQEISEKTRSLLAALALTYWAENAHDRWKLAEKLHLNELKYQGKPEAAMTQDEYQELLSAFDDWNELFGPIPFWAVSRNWYPMECYEIVEDGEEADIWAGKTGLKMTYVPRKTREQIAEEASQWLLVSETEEEEVLYWHDDYTEKWHYTKEDEKFFEKKAVIKDGHFYGALIGTDSVSSFGMSVYKSSNYGILCIDGSKDGTTEEYYHHSSSEVSEEKNTVYSLKRKRKEGLEK